VGRSFSSAAPRGVRAVSSLDVVEAQRRHYEVLIGAIVFAVVWPLRKRLTQPTSMMWIVIGLLAVGRFGEFYVRSGSPNTALGLETAQWTSLLLIVVAVTGAWLTHRAQRRVTAPAGRSRSGRRRRSA
jgi:prolipoprotein diacylglyceryltransferase